jgi:hypothetical protein
VQPLTLLCQEMQALSRGWARGKNHRRGLTLSLDVDTPILSLPVMDAVPTVSEVCPGVATDCATQTPALAAKPVQIEPDTSSDHDQRSQACVVRQSPQKPCLSSVPKAAVLQTSETHSPLSSSSPTSQPERSVDRADAKLLRVLIVVSRRHWQSSSVDPLSESVAQDDSNLNITILKSLLGAMLLLDPPTVDSVLCRQHKAILMLDGHKRTSGRGCREARPRLK